MQMQATENWICGSISSGMWRYVVVGLPEVFVSAVKGAKSFLFALLDPEDEDTMILRNVANHSPKNTASHPRRLEPSAASLWEPQILCIKLQIIKKLGARRLNSSVFLRCGPELLASL